MPVVKKKLEITKKGKRKKADPKAKIGFLPKKIIIVIIKKRNITKPKKVVKLKKSLLL